MRSGLLRTFCYGAMMLVASILYIIGILMLVFTVAELYSVWKSGAEIGEPVGHDTLVQPFGFYLVSLIAGAAVFAFGVLMRYLASRLKVVKE